MNDNFNISTTDFQRIVEIIQAAQGRVKKGLNQKVSTVLTQIRRTKKSIVSPLETLLQNTINQIINTINLTPELSSPTSKKVLSHESPDSYRDFPQSYISYLNSNIKP